MSRYVGAIVENWAVTRTKTPSMTAQRRGSLTRSWDKAVARSFGWA
jgi:glycerol kinase